MTLDEPLLTVASRYTRSIHLTRDYARITDGLAGYQVTPLVATTIARIVAGLAPTATARAFSLVGMYGAGKSAFGVFLAHFLASDPEARHLLLRAHARNTLAEQVPLGAPVLLPVLVSGSHTALGQTLMHALRETLVTYAPSAYADLQSDLDAALEGSVLDSAHIVALYEHAIQAVQAVTAYDGIVLIVDELGQFLDYAAYQQSERDLFVLQVLAEMAARSDTVPFLIVTILHQAFEQYAGTAGPMQRQEWAKVQGRYIDLPFQEPASEMLRMIGRALCPEPQQRNHPERQQWATALAPLSDALGLRPPEIGTDEWVSLLAETYPLHPTVLVALPMLFRQLAQNERSLFAFLVTHEPWSLRDVVEQRSTDVLPIYRLTHLYAYVEAVLGPSLFGRAQGRRWAELAEARQYLHANEVLHQDALTVIGTLNALGQQRGLRASAAHLSLALADSLDDATVLQTIEQLMQRAQIVYRKHRDSYLLWEGSDLDLDTLVTAARQQVGDQVALIHLLQEYAAPVPLVARRHSYRTGTIRMFATHFVGADALPDTQVMPPTTDGEVLAIVPADDEALAAAQQWAMQPERANEPWRVLVLPQRVHTLRDLLLDVAARRIVLEKQPELEYDAVARRELTSQLHEAEQVLHTLIDAAFGAETGVWFWCGERQTISTARQLDALLSTACDTTYPDTPHIWNELILRRHLSSAAAKARRNLIERMLDDAHLENLGITGYPPERAVYASVFQRSGIHRQEVDGRWRFGPPSEDDPLHVRPTWIAIQEFIDTTAIEARPITELYGQLARPPFGLKEGLIPLLFVGAFLANAGEIALYEHGNYVTVPDITMFERLLRQPGYFAIRQSRATALRIAVYERLARVLAPKALEQPVQPALMHAITPLLRLMKRLPEYSRTTRRVSREAQAIRRALLEAKEPDVTLFETLPCACGLEPFTIEAEPDDPRFDMFFAALREGLQELQDAYPHMVAYAAERVQQAFGAASADLSALHTELVERSRHIREITSDNQLRSLGVRLDTAEDGTAWLESVGALLIRKPMPSWRDEDVQRFELQLADLGQRFCWTERISRVVSTGSASTTMAPDAAEEPLSSSAGWNAQMRELHHSLTTALHSHTLTDEQRIQVLLELLDPLFERTDGEKDI